MILVYFGTNDGGLARYADKDLTFLKLAELLVVRNICLKSKLFQFIIKKTYNYEKNNKWNVRVNPDDFRENLEAIKNECRKNQIKFLFIKPCLRNEVETGIPNNNYIPPMPYIDLFEVFKGYKNYIGEVFVDHKHFTNLGHIIIAQDIYKFLFRPLRLPARRQAGVGNKNRIFFI